MEMNHTPGNWYAKDGQIYPTETGKTLALIPYFDKNNKEEQANQQLIAAAPDLLNALAMFIHSVEHEGVMFGRVADAVKNAKQAIDKAII
jgi:amino acid permease